MTRFMSPQEEFSREVEILDKINAPVADDLAKLPDPIRTEMSDSFDENDPALVRALVASMNVAKKNGKPWSARMGKSEVLAHIKLASKMLTEHTIGRTVDAHSEQFVAQNKINEEVQQDLSFNAGEHNALKGRVQRTEQDMGKLEGEQGMAKNVIDTMRERDAAMAHQQSEKDRELLQEVARAAKFETQANAKKMEADAMEQERDEWKGKCEAMVAQKEVHLAKIAEQQRDNAVLEAQLKHKKEDAAELARARREVKAVEQRENDRKEREAKDRRKSAEAAKEVAAEARAKTMAAELERDTVRRENDALVIRVKALDPERLRSPQESDHRLLLRRRRRDGVCRPLRLECSQRNLGAWRAAADGRGHAVECHVVEVARRLTDRARQHQHEHGHHDPRPDKLRRPRGQRKPRQVGRRGQAEEGSRED